MHFEQASYYNHEYAFLFMAIIHFSGFGLPKRDPQKAITLFKKVAVTWNNPVAQYMLGCMYTEGDQDVDTNIKYGLSWFRVAANQDWTYAMVRLHDIYFLFPFITGNTRDAIHLIEKVANKDNSNTELVDDGTIYLFGNKDFELSYDHVKQSKPDLIKYITKSGLSSPIGYFYDSETYGVPDFDEEDQGILLWDIFSSRKASIVPACQLYLSIVYSVGVGRVHEDMNKSIYWAKKAAKNKNEAACLILGRYYESGTDVKKNYKEAKKWFEKAREIDGSSIATFYLGTFYHSGKGVKRDCKKALGYFESVVNQDEHGHAYYLMGNIYHFGKDGVPQSYKKACDYYLKAFLNGFAEGATEIGLMYQKGLHFAKDEERAYCWFVRGAVMGCPIACYLVGSIHYRGYHGKVDLEKALSFFLCSLAGGYSLALRMVLLVDFVRSRRRIVHYHLA